MNPRIRPRRLPDDPRAHVLRAWLDPLTVRIRDEEVRWLAARPDFDPADPDGAASALVGAARACLSVRRRMLDRADALRAQVAGTEGVARREALARHLRVTVTDPTRLREDFKALDRDLDLDALLEREAHEVETQGARVEVVVRALGGVFPRLLSGTWEGAGIHALLCEVAEWDPRAPTRRAAVSVLAQCTSTLAARDARLDPRGLRLLRALVRAPDEEPWVRRAALGVARGLESALAHRWLTEAIETTEGREPFLLRAKAVELVLERPEWWALTLLEGRRDDPSELVRATLIDGLAQRFAANDDAAGEVLARMLAKDPEPKIRARGAAALREVGEAGLPLLAARVRDTPLVASFAIDTALAAARARLPFPPDLAEALDECRRTAEPGLARRAALALHADRVVGGPGWYLASGLDDRRPGERRVVDLPEGASVDDLAEALAVFAFDGYGFWLDPDGRRVAVTRGDVMRPTLWRVLHELRHPAPAKRQGYTHAVGRADVGIVRVPPGRLAEESATGVPGQRLRVDREEGWAPAVPLVDDLLHATQRDGIRVVTPEGRTYIRAPERLRDRFVAQARLVFGYARFDALRTASLEERDPALRHRYLTAVRELGFEVDPPDEDGPSAPFFRGAAAVVDPVAYLVSMGANSLTHLALVVTMLFVWLVGRATLAKIRVRRARSRLALVIGGWGTRGKSGTERLKAGVLEGLGIPLVSKTTGCEAMILHAPPGGHALELFLFRPYDKATIWEQVDVVSLADRLGARAMLWECMGLNPKYVHLLQVGWMRDDLSTLTNAYPDHEDIQGPTGMDVAEVIGGFSPPDALLLCTEENMLPVIAEQARLRNATLQPVKRVTRELVPKDLMDRMPHAEHPANVSLAAAVAEALGVPTVEAIGLMAEHVVPDLGALILYPRAKHMGREVVFANGMSANDTLSFKHNWRRTGFLTHDHATEPAKWLVTVVNNRADRVARSRVFAQIVANDANAHRHVLIGTNLRGLAMYIDGAVEERLGAWVLDGDPARVDALFAHLRIVDAAALGDACGKRLGAPDDARLAWIEAAYGVSPVADLDAARAAAAATRPVAAALEAACGPDGAGLADHLVEALARQTAYLGARTAPPDATRAVYRALMKAAIVVVEDSATSGDRIIGIATGAVPPGADAMIMGIQNIKGTGLDFAYQWVFWRELHKQLGALATPDAERRRAALDAIEQNPFGSILACEAAIATLEPLRRDAAVGLRVSALLLRIEAQRAALLAARRGEGTSKKQRGLASRVAERFLDPFDGILRRERARQVFADLAERRISHRRAQAELKRLTERQKGGWFGS